MLKVLNFGLIFLVSTPQGTRAQELHLSFLHLVNATQHEGWGGGGAC